ncbi:hypothetical protein GCM10010909_28790 [Acidocella aquatica]|uniref:DUF2282 domain-containing protein n=1 Tax=Acidocella aquatica TaxID=1922313 RepID=A0ABQ6A9B4_9PROT|nr:DUF2282 domain-containing protein [Acidocella aquatica]GLR68198.1 hypothetical protein GCM10010909_28790 [Acidocella aquatica]
MDRRKFAASVLTAAIGFAGIVPVAASAQQMTQQQMMQVKQANMARAAAQKLQACYGVNAVGRNDCASGAHSCAGQATMARDPASFVLLPGGDCSKIAGGSLKAS